TDIRTLLSETEGQKNGQTPDPAHPLVTTSLVRSKQQGEQSLEALSVREGDSLALNCSYTDSAIYSLQWFRQDPGKGLASLLLIQSNQREQISGRIKALLDKTSRHNAFYIAASQPGD
uniref:Ig-like domain-containing protein n=1 Tax=Equus caballus TaxID=9796 RepID=A0A9L0R9U3_HORSE